MGKMNWGGVFLCGILTGTVYVLLGLVVFIFALPETAFVAAVEAARAAGRKSSSLPPILHCAGGIWTMWLYAAIRPRYGPRPKTAAIAGFAVWVIGALAAAQWGSSGLLVFPLGALLAPLAVSLPTIIVAAVLGAWLYEELAARLHGL